MSPRVKGSGKEEGLCLCVCAEGGRVQKSETELETEGWEIQKTEQGATQWGRYETREQRQGSLRQTDEEDRDQERPETRDHRHRERQGGSREMAPWVKHSYEQV